MTLVPLELLGILLLYLKHLFDEELKNFVLFSDFKLLNLLNAIKLDVIWCRLHGCEFLLHLLKCQYLFSLFDHDILLSLNHVLFTRKFLFEPFILSIKGLLDHLDGRSTGGLSDDLVAHSSRFLDVCCLLGKHSSLLIGEAWRHIWLIEHLLKCALRLPSIVLYALLHFNLGGEGLPLHPFDKIFLLLINRGLLLPIYSFLIL
jgi:hypothetical protein